MNIINLSFLSPAFSGEKAKKRRLKKRKLKRENAGFNPTLKSYPTLDAAIQALGNFAGSICKLGQDFFVLATTRKTKGKNSEGPIIIHGKEADIVHRQQKK